MSEKGSEMNEKRRAEVEAQLASMTERDKELGRRVTELLADCASWQEQDKVLEYVLRILMAPSPERGASAYPALAFNLGVVLDRALPDELVDELTKVLMRGDPDYAHLVPEEEPETAAGVRGGAVASEEQGRDLLLKIRWGQPWPADEEAEEKQPGPFWLVEVELSAEGGEGQTLWRYKVDAPTAEAAGALVRKHCEARLKPLVEAGTLRDVTGVRGGVVASEPAGNAADGTPPVTQRIGDETWVLTWEEVVEEIERLAGWFEDVIEAGPGTARDILDGSDPRGLPLLRKLYTAFAAAWEALCPDLELANLWIDERDGARASEGEEDGEEEQAEGEWEQE